MGVPEDVAMEEASVDPDQALGVERAAHVVDIGLAGAVEAGEVAAAEGVEDPGELILWVVLEESPVRGGSGVLEDVDGGGRVGV